PHADLSSALSRAASAPLPIPFSASVSPSCPFFSSFFRFPPSSSLSFFPSLSPSLPSPFSPSFFPLPPSFLFSLSSFPPSF
ncbi:hypothetical protein ACXWRW_11370, partial [Streptococcus pyogenes]